MLSQKRKARSPPTCLPCCRQRSHSNSNPSCDRCIERDSTDPPSYNRNMTSRNMGSSDNLADNGPWTNESAVPCAFDLSGISVTVDKSDWLHIQEELQYLRAQHRKFLAVQGLIRARNWIALDMYGSLQHEGSGHHEPQVMTEKMKVLMTRDASHSVQDVVCPTQHDYQIPSLANSHALSASGHTFQNKTQTLAAMPSGPVQSIAGLSSDMNTPRNSYAWRTSPFNPTSPTPSLTITRSSSVSVAPHKTLWTHVTRSDEIEPRQAQMSQWSFESVPPHDRGEILEGRVVTHPNSKTVTGDMDLQWRDANLSTIPVPSDLHLFFDPEPDAEFDLDLASGFAIHPPMVRPEWRSPQIRPVTLSKREPVMLPNLSSHAPNGNVYPAQWSTELAPAVYPAIEVNNDPLIYPTPTTMNPPNSSHSQSPSTVATPVGKPTFKELPIRFTQSMYNTLKDFSLPPSLEKDSPFVNDASHYAHGSFKPRQYNPSKDYIIQT